MIISSTPCTRPRCDVPCQWGDCEQSCLQSLHVMSERPSPAHPPGLSPGGDRSTPQNKSASDSRDHFEEMELRELDMRRLPSCVDALTVSELRSRYTALVFVARLFPTCVCHLITSSMPSRFWMPSGFGQTPRKSESKLWQEQQRFR